MVDRDRVLDVAVGFAQCLICEALNPKYASERDPCGHALIKLESNNVRPMDRCPVAVEHLFNALTRAGLVSQEMQRRSGHTFANQLVGDIARACRKAAE